MPGCWWGHAGAAQHVPWVLSRCLGSLGSQSLPGTSLPDMAGKQGPLCHSRILNKFLDGYQEDALPWHECVEPCLSSLSAHSSDCEVRGPWDSCQAGSALLAVTCTAWTTVRCW